MVVAEMIKNDLETSPKGYKGRAVYRGIFFQWTLNLQKDGSFRGRITARDLSSGKTISFVKKQLYAKKGAKEIKQKWRELNTRAKSEKEVREYISSIIQNIFADNERLFLRILFGSVTPETITIGLACELLGTEYINNKYPKIQETTKTLYLVQLKDSLAILSTKPMAYYSDHPSEAMRILNKAKVGNATIKKISEFWDFAIYKGRYIQKNPITVPEADSKEKKHKDPKRLKKVPDEVAKRAYHIMLERHDGKDCGSSMAFSGFSLADICSFYWRDILFPLLESHDCIEDIEIEDFCVVLYKRPNLLIAVHDYRRPFIPICAMVIFRRLKELLEKFDKEELYNLPVVSTSTDSRKAMDPKALQNAIKELLLESGIEDKILKLSKESSRDPISSNLLLNTYKNDLINTCKMKSGSGTYNYLLGHSLGDDTTSTNYVSFSDENAQKRLYKILRRLKQKCKIESPPRVLREEYGCEIATVSPDYSDEVVGDFFDLVLLPGEEVVVSSQSGAQLDIKVIGTSAIEEEKAD